VAIGFACWELRRKSAAIAELRFTTCRRPSRRVSACGPVPCPVIDRRGVPAKSSERPRFDCAPEFQARSGSRRSPFEHAKQAARVPDRIGLFILDLFRMGVRRGGSGRWGDRPLVGIGGDGGAATRGTRPESTVILPVVGGTVDSQLDSIVSVPSYLSSNFDASSPIAPSLWSRVSLSRAHLVSCGASAAERAHDPQIDSVVIAPAFSLECGPCQPSHLRSPSARDRFRRYKSSA
jgi:hypothetical protein